MCCLPVLAAPSLYRGITGTRYRMRSLKDPSGLAFLPDGRLMVATSGGDLSLFDVTSDGAEIGIGLADRLVVPHAHLCPTLPVSCPSCPYCLRLSIGWTGPELSQDCSCCSASPSAST